MTLTQVECFEAVCESMSFSKAAGMLYVSQPSISKSISRLEEELGHVLFERENNRLVLTPAGELFREGARDVYTQPIGMKKSRPGVMLCAICLPEDADRLAAVMMKHTSTLGVRRQDMSRYTLARETETADTLYGPVRVKKASGMGVVRRKAEYDDLAALAEKTGLSLREIRERLGFAE